MALPTLDATFASSVDLPRRQMLARWLVEELGSGSIADYYDLPERYLWAKIAVAAGAPRPEAEYISLPKNYAWSDIYNAVSGDIANSAVVVSGAGTSSSNGTYVKTGFSNGKPIYNFGLNTIGWSSADSYWYIFDDETIGDIVYISYEDTPYPWQAASWILSETSGVSPAPTLTPKTPNHTDWVEKQALGHIAAAYRGDTGTPANLATYIDWPWRYQVAAIIASTVDPYAMNVSLLLHMDGTNGSTTFIDYSINNLTVTPYGDVQISTTNKVFGTGSALFDGDGDYLEITDVAPFEFGSEDFTIECWVYMVAGAGGTTIARWNGDENAFWFWVSTVQGIDVYLNNTAIPEVTGGTVTPDQWHHVCLVRNGNDLRSFIDGQQVGTTATFTDPINTSAATLRIGWDAEINPPFNGRIDELRISKGVARYTGNFTPPTAPFPNP